MKTGNVASVKLTREWANKLDARTKRLILASATNRVSANLMYVPVYMRCECIIMVSHVWSKQLLGVKTNGTLSKT